MNRKVSKELEKNLEKIFTEILTDQISSFSFEELSGMVVKFLNGDQFTDLTFGNLEINFNEKVLYLSNKEQFFACEEKKWFVKRKIFNIDLVNGDLVFIFEGKNKLIFKHSNSVENWELRWRSKATLVSLPGGEVDLF